MGFPINENLTQGLAPLSQKSSTSVTTAVLSDAVDLSRSRKVVAYFWVGALAAAETITCKLQASSTSGGTYSDVSGSSVTFTKTGTDDNKWQAVELTAQALQNLNATNGTTLRFVKASFAGAVGSPAGVIVLGGGGPEEPQSNLAVTTFKAATVLN